MRTAIGLLALSLAGVIVPVGSPVAQYLTPLLMGTAAAFVLLLSLCLGAVALRHRRALDLEAASTRPAPRASTAVRTAAPRTT